MKYALAAAVFLTLPGVSAAATPAPPASAIAFPGAEGAGRFSAGGRGGRLIRVTTLADSGPGISAEDAARVFEEFYQVRSETGAHLGGTGLGLAISQRLAEALGGTLTVASELGHGAEFTLRLPIGDALPAS